MKKGYSKPGRWRRKAADQEREEAQYVLGIMYMNGVGVQQNRPKAIEFSTLLIAREMMKLLKTCRAAI